MKFKLLIMLGMLVSISFAQQKTTTNSVKSDKVSVTLTESEDRYELKAAYDEALTDKVRAYMNNTIAKGTSTNFKNTEVDAEMTLDNHASFYISSHPGKLSLKLDKRKNSAEIYKRFKEMCEGIKNLITQNK
jgi:hypothetical protein